MSVEFKFAITVTLFDHSGALAVSRSQQLNSNSSSLLPNSTTSTGLPPQTEAELRRSAARLILPVSFWQKLPISAVPPLRSPLLAKSTVLEIRSENRGVISPKIATSELYTPSQSIVPVQTALLDSRFGPISLDWIDYTPMSDTASTAGQTALNWGIVHLYREAGATDSTEEEKTKAVSEDDGTIVGVICVPGNIAVTNFLKFIAPALDSLVQLRMLRDSSPNRNLVLIRFKTSSDADQFRRVFLGKPYNENKDSELCQVVPISSIKLKSTTTPPFTFPYSPTDSEPSSLIELPSCPICLERLDGTHSGLITVSCQHLFHCSCLMKWGDSNCPVCRSTSSRARKPVVNLMHCAICQSESNLWQCLICGNVGCGRYQGGHAHSHYDESHHSYSLEIKTQRIWSYLNDEYVHRLIQRDGKLVELPSLVSREAKTVGGVDKEGGPDEQKDEEMNKIEMVSIEIDNLLTTQLLSQREYYESLLEKSNLESLERNKKLDANLLQHSQLQSQHKQLESTMKNSQIKASTEKSNVETKLANLIKKSHEEELQRKKERLEMKGKVKQVEKELEAEKMVTSSLTTNLTFLKQTLSNAATETQDLRAQMGDLQEQMRDVMFALTARDQIESQGGSELMGGDVSIRSPPVPTVNATKKKKKR